MQVDPRAYLLEAQAVQVTELLHKVQSSSKVRQASKKLAYSKTKEILQIQRPPLL